MSLRAARWFSVVLTLLAFPTLGFSQSVERSVITTPDSDYFGFDLRTERDVSLDQCSAICLADGDCRAYTYNTKAQWCFLKSDYSVMKPFAGAVAGRVVNLAGDPDIGAPSKLGFLPSYFSDEVRRYRQSISDLTQNQDDGLVYLSSAADSAMHAGDARAASQNYRSALAIADDQSDVWSRLAEALLAIQPENSDETAELSRDASSAAAIGYELTRTVTQRAQSLAVLAKALDRRDLYRPALQAYEASLTLSNDATVRAAYLDLKSRKGFRVIGNTVETDSATPRACIQFSEQLVKSGQDYAPFITINDGPPQAVEAKGQQICIEGLRHGENYRINIRQGLPAAIGEVTEAPVALAIYVRDRAPSIRFSGENFVLPSAGRHGIPMVSVNSTTADLKLYRIGDRSLASLLNGYQFLRQLDAYALENLTTESGELMWEGAIELENELNKEIVTSFPVSEALPERQPGVYVLSATPEGDMSEAWDARATQWFVVSDIGLSTYTGEDGLTVFARSLATAKPMVGVEVQLLARNNEILGTATTDDQGRAVFTPGLIRGTSGMAPSVLTASLPAGDFVFLDMTKPGFDLSDRGVTGRTAPGALDVFAWTERGIYRAGETVHGAALARDDSAEAVEALPLTFIYSRPDGVEDRRIVSDHAALGGHYAPLALEPTAMLGTWSMAVHTDPKMPAVAQANFLVEQFVPDRIEFDLNALTTSVATDEPIRMEVQGRYLYGAPAADLEFEGEVSVRLKRDWERFPGYFFGLSDEEVDAVSIPLDINPADEDGHSSFESVLSPLPATTALLEAQVAVRMREGGGRAVERRTPVTITPEQTVLGIRPEFGGKEVPENSTAALQIIAVSPDGERISLPSVNWTLNKIERSYQWYRSNNSWNYEAITTESRVDSGKLAIRADEPAKLGVRVAWGRYRLDVEGDNAGGPAASFEFNAGWFVEAASTETPDGLEIALDKERYEAGETARLKVSPRFAGELLVTVGSDRLFTTLTQTIPSEGAEIAIPVSQDWGGGAYVTAALFRPGDAKESRMPARAIGVKWLSIDPGKRSLGVTLGLPSQISPREELVIPVALSGLAPGEEAYVTVAAVDVGILNLTRYSAPDPQGWYFGQRRLGLELRDLYGRLIDGSMGAFGRLRTGGDGGGMAVQGNPPTEKLVAFFSGPVQVGDDGKAQVSFPIPEFNGTARVMAVAWSKSAIGQASGDIVIRDPLVVTAGQPRFLAAGDQASIRLDIHNTDGPSGNYALSIATDGKATFDLGSAPESVNLETGSRAVVDLPITALTTGDATLTVALTNNNGTTVQRTLFIPVRQPSMPLTSRQTVNVPAGGTLQIDEQLLSDSLMDGASISIGISPLAALDIPSMLTSLDRYPYGCTEQTTSRAMPLLYVSELAKASGIPDDPALRQRVQDAIGRVLSAQTSSGTFGLWGPGYGDMWLDAYIAEFLTRSREAGYLVPVQGFTAALDNLQNQLAYTTDIQDRGTEIAYALYVLARNRKASVGDLRYYADARIEEFASPMARAQIAAALALYGDNPRAERTFAAALRAAESGSNDSFYRSDYGSTLRDSAAVLALAAETRPAPAAIPALTRFVAQQRQEKTYLSTQEQVWMLLAARAINDNDSDIQLEIDGVPHSGSFARRIEGEELQATALKISNRGQQPVDAVITTVAAPADPLPAGGDGFTIERTYYSLDGEEANITEATQNDRYVVVLRIVENNDWPSRVVITDLLPAGLEIDNPRLIGSAELSNFEWLGEPGAAHSEFRDDRFVAAFDRDDGGEFVVAYVVRAVTPGIYSHPAAVVEDMYRPQFNARSASGMMEVVAAQ